MQWIGWAVIVVLAAECFRVPAMRGDVGAAAAWLGIGALFLLAVSIEVAARGVARAVAQAVALHALAQHERAGKEGSRG